MLHFFDEKWFFAEEIDLKLNQYALTKLRYMVLNH